MNTVLTTKNAHETTMKVNTTNMMQESMMYDPFDMTNTTMVQNMFTTNTNNDLMNQC